MPPANRFQKWAGALVVLCSFGLLFFGPQTVMADLPPRPTPVTKTIASPALRGGFIEVDTGVLAAGQGTIVQWQTLEGKWVDVATWFGHTEADGRKRWWVAPEDFATGPFRWQILDEDGQVIAVTEPFTMPEQHGQIVVSSIDLP